MANEKINEYTKTRTVANLESLDLMDLDSTDDGGVSYESAKISVADFLAYINLNGKNIYNNDGTVTGNRTLTANTFWTKWVGGDVIVQMADEVTDYAFLIKDISSTEMGRLGYDQLTLGAVLELISVVRGTFFKADDDKVLVVPPFETQSKIVGKIQEVDTSKVLDDDAEQVLLLDGIYTLTLPPAEAGRKIEIINKKTIAGPVTLNAVSGLVNGSASVPLPITTRYAILQVRSDGVDWFVGGQ